MDDKNKKLLKPDDQIQALVQAAGATPYKTIICSCGTGREATNEFLPFRFYSGYKNVVLYEGGFTGGSSYPRNLTVTGRTPGDLISFLLILNRMKCSYEFDYLYQGT
jgi:thiosulfate/3-mercaptopyruvate sulfurtransferase